MINRIARYSVSMLLLVLLASTAWADDEDQCQNACPDGEVRVGFLDGHVGSCMCVPPGAPMEDVVGEPSEGPESEG